MRTVCRALHAAPASLNGPAATGDCRHRRHARAGTLRLPHAHPWRTQEAQKSKPVPSVLKEAAMNFLIMLIVGGIAGWLASMVMRTDGQQGIILNVIVDRKSTRLNSSHVKISYAVFCLKK